MLHLALCAVTVTLSLSQNTEVDGQLSRNQTTTHVAKAGRVTGPSDQFLTEEAATNMNGRVFASRPGPVDSARAFGAGQDAPATIVVRVPGLFGFESARSFEIRPFEPVTTESSGNHWSNPFSNASKKLAAKVEAARQQWLKDNNYTGGIRTFVNDKSGAGTKVGAASSEADSQIKPRATIELQPDSPRFRSKTRVMKQGESPSRSASRNVTRVVPQEPVLAKDSEPAAAAPGHSAG